MAVPYTITDKTITVVIGKDMRPQTIPSSHPNFEEIRKLVTTGKATEKNLANLVDIPKAITKFTEGQVEVHNGKLYFKGYEVGGSLASLILGFIKAGNEVGARPFKLFLEKSFANPDPRAASDLYDWVVRSKLPITPEGNILAWKAVRADYGSIHGNPPLSRFDHHPGNTVEEDRKFCDPDPNKTCSRGLHFCSADYLSNYGSGGFGGGNSRGHRVVALEISPEDVVAFPKDANGAKGRAWRYRVVGEVPPEKAAEFYPKNRLVYDGYKKPAAKAASTGPKRAANGRFA